MSTSRVKKVVVAVGFGGCILAVAYSAVRTFEADSTFSILLGAFGVALFVVLAALRWVTADQAEKGILHNIYRVLPTALDWSCRLSIRLVLATTLMIFTAAASIWLGPMSLHSINIKTDSAAFVRVDTDSESQLKAGDGLLTLEVWRPGQSHDQVLGAVRCLNEHLKPWKPQRRQNLLECGEPLAPVLIENGIDLSSVDQTTTDGRRTIENVMRLRQAMNQALPQRDVTDALLIATWNVRRLGRSERLQESTYYIAEILSHFDAVAIQEVDSKLDALHNLIDLLGSNYSCVYSLTSPCRSGNKERMAYIYDRRKMRVGEMVSNVILCDSVQPRRSPYAVTFDALGRRFALVNVHLAWGSGGWERLAEAKAISSAVYKQWEIEPLWGDDLILMGTINSADKNGEEAIAFADCGFTVHPELSDMSTYHWQNRAYGQLFTLHRPASTMCYGRVGVFDFRELVFRVDEEDSYRAEMGEKYTEKGDSASRSSFYSRWTLRQMSDHFPKWVEFRFIESSSED